MQITTEVEEINVNPVLNFFFALKAPESKRQYPKRFEMFLDYLKLDGTFEDKALSFYKKAIENPQWLTNNLLNLHNSKNNEHKKERFLNQLFQIILKQLNSFA